MAQRKMRLGGLAVGLALALLALGQFGTIQAGAGRDFSRCVQSCNETRSACRTQCKVDCDLLFPKGADRDACDDGCADTCSGNSQECKVICQNIKNPPSEPEP